MVRAASSTRIDLHRVAILKNSPALACMLMCQTHGVVNCLWEDPELAETSMSPDDLASSRARAEACWRLWIARQTACTASCTRSGFQLASGDVAKKCGIDEVEVGQGEMKEVLGVHGDLMYDQTRIAVLSPRVSGTLWRVFKQVGDPIERAATCWHRSKLPTLDESRENFAGVSADREFYLAPRTLRHCGQGVCHGAKHSRSRDLRKRRIRQLRKHAFGSKAGSSRPWIISACLFRSTI